MSAVWPLNFKARNKHGQGKKFIGARPEARIVLEGPPSSSVSGQSYYGGYEVDRAEKLPHNPTLLEKVPL